jgi:hypothetical protein
MCKVVPALLSVFQNICSNLYTLLSQGKARIFSIILHNSYATHSGSK